MVTSKLKDNSSLNGQLRIPVAYYKPAYFTWQCGEGAGGAAQQFDEAGRQCDEAARQCILRRHRFASLIQLLDVPVVSKLYEFSFSSTLCVSWVSIRALLSIWSIQFQYQCCSTFRCCNVRCLFRRFITWLAVRFELWFFFFWNQVGCYSQVRTFIIC